MRARTTTTTFLLAVVLLVFGMPGAGAAARSGQGAPETGPVAVEVVAGWTHTCALLDDGTVKCWGFNGYGQLGYGDTNDRGDANGEMGADLPIVALGTGRTATALAAGRDHTCALLDDGTVKCWGRNSDAQLGQGDADHRGDAPSEMGDDLLPVDLGTGRTATAIAAGSFHTCALLDNGALVCWGENFRGQLGDPNHGLRGDGPGEMGDSLVPVSLGTGRAAVAVSTGEIHTCALLDNDTVKCWGDNSRGQLGLGDQDNRGDDTGEMGDALPVVQLGTGRTATAITTGITHTCALLDNGTVKCWGMNNVGQLGLGTSADQGDNANEMGDALPAPSLGTGRTALTVTAGDTHTCALLDDATLKCWGANFAGQLGLGDRADRGDGSAEMGDSLPVTPLGTGRSPVRLAAGAGHTCALLDDDTLKCWGDSSRGQLGYGSFTKRGDDPGEMGDALPAVDLGGAPVTRQVDAEIRKSSQTTYKGDGIYNTSAAGQSVTQNVRRGTSARFVVQVRNEGTATDDLRVSGPGSSGRFTVRYTVGATNVTAQVVAGTYEFAAVPAGAARKMTVQVTVAANATVNATKAVRVRVTSVGDPTEKDAVMATVKAIR